VAWLASLAEDGCEYAKVSGGPDSILGSNGFNVLDGVANPPPFLEIGFSGWRHPIYYPDESDEGQVLGVWKANVSGSCLVFPTVTVDRTNSETGDIDITTLFSPDMLMDTSWQASKIFAFLSLVFGGGGALFLWFSSCFVFGPGSWRIAGYELLLAFVFQSLAFVWFNTSICSGSVTTSASATLTAYNNNNYNNTCSLFVGSRTDIMAAVFWLVSAISIFYKYPTPSGAAGSGVGVPQSSPTRRTTSTRIVSASRHEHEIIPEAEMVDIDVNGHGQDHDPENPTMATQVAMIADLTLEEEDGTVDKTREII
jgi:hypothetical protein